MDTSKLKKIKKRHVLIICLMLILFCPIDAAHAASCPGGGNHYYSVNIIKPVTETEDGLERHTCKKCGDTYDVTVTKTGHNFSDWQIKSQPTCNKDGVKYKKCSICGKTEQQIIKRTGHSFSGWKQITKADCTHHGEENKTCSVCGFKDVRITKSPGHQYKLVSENNIDGYQVSNYECSVCGDTKIEKIPVSKAAEAEAKSEVSNEILDVQEDTPTLEPSKGFTPLEIILMSAIGGVGIFNFFILRDDFYIIKWHKAKRLMMRGRMF